MIVTSMPPVAPMIRPSTSPVPTVGTPELRKASAPPGGAQSKLLMLQQRVALRPLPPRSGGISMFIEGSKTGEEKIIGRPDRREPVAIKATGSVTADGESEKEQQKAQRDRERARRLETEVQRLQEQLKRKKEEQEESRAAGLRLSASMDSMKVRLEEKISSLQAELQHRDLGDSCRSDALEKLRRENEELIAKWSTKEATMALENTNLLAKLAESEASNKAHATQLEAKSKASSDHASEILALKQRVVTLERDLSTGKDRWASDLAAARDKEIQLLAQVAALKQQVADSAENVAQWKQRVQDCNDYVVKVCQPQFTVVKDESLVPLNGKPSGPGSGFVLVPLPLLLEGYGLLPPDVKKKIAAAYEQQGQRRM